MPSIKSTLQRLITRLWCANLISTRTIEQVFMYNRRKNIERAFMYRRKDIEQAFMYRRKDIEQAFMYRRNDIGQAFLYKRKDIEQAFMYRRKDIEQAFMYRRKDIEQAFMYTRKDIEQAFICRQKDIEFPQMLFIDVTLLSKRCYMWRLCIVYYSSEYIIQYAICIIHADEFAYYSVQWLEC